MRDEHVSAMLNPSTRRTQAKTEGRLILLLLQRFLQGFPPGDVSDEARRVALRGYGHAISSLVQVLFSEQDGSLLLTRQSQIAQTVVSLGGLNDAARTYLRGQDSNFVQLVQTTVVPFTISDGDENTARKYVGPVTEQKETLPESFRPMVLGSGRLAAAFVAGFQRLGVPNDNLALFSRSPPAVSHNDHMTTTATETTTTNPAHPFQTWLQLLGSGHPAPRRWYSPETMGVKNEGDDDGYCPDVIFLLIKRKAFDNLEFRQSFQCFWDRCGRPVLVNLMAGKPLELLLEHNAVVEEVVVRANVLVSHPGAGNLLCCSKQRHNPDFAPAFRVLSHLGQLLSFSRREMLGKLTFFTSTVPLVLMSEFDQALHAKDGHRSVVLRHNLAAAWAERIGVSNDLLATTDADIEGAEADVLTDLEEVAMKYMEIYLGLA